MIGRKLLLPVLFILFVNRSIGYVQGESNFIPMYEFPPVANVPMSRSPYQPMMRYPESMQHLNLQRSSSLPQRQQVTQSSNVVKDTDGFNFSFSDLVEAINEINHHNEENERGENSRAAGVRDYDQPYSLPHPASYGYPNGPLTPSYHEPAAAPTHHASPATKTSFLKPDLGDLVKPLATKAAKASGLVQTLLTGAIPKGLEIKGIKDVFFEDVLKPLLTAKSSLKALIAKLIVPVISLVLINLEVLLTVWWLWEDCKVQPPPPPQIHPENSYNYSSYR